MLTNCVDATEVGPDTNQPQGIHLELHSTPHMLSTTPVRPIRM